MKACGLPVVRLHDTRHSACSLPLVGGVPIEIVQMLLGHSTPDVTRKVYATARELHLTGEKALVA